MTIKNRVLPLDLHTTNLTKNRGHVRPKPPIIDINQQGRLRSGHVLALCGISHSTLYLRMKQKLFPQPDGKDGGLNYWNTQTIKKYLESDFIGGVA